MPTFHIKLLCPSSSKKPCRESRMLRNTREREDMSIPGSVFDCQPSRRVPEESCNDSRNLAASSGIQRREGIEKSGSEEKLQPMHLPCFSGKANEKVWTTEKCPKSLAHHAGGIGTCAQSGMINPSHPSSETHLGKFPDHTEVQSWVVNFRTKVCSKAENPTRALQWIKEIEAAKSPWTTSSLQNQ